MKKLLLIAGTIVFIGNIAGQRQKEELVPLSSSASIQFDNSANTGVVMRSRCCFCITTREVVENTNYLMDHMYMNTYNSTDVLLGGMPRKFGKIKKQEMPVEGSVGSISSCRINSEIFIDGLKVRQINNNTKDVSIKKSKSFLSGIILDEDKNPVWANILIEGENIKDKGIGSQTDKEGRFGIELPEGNINITITSVGYIESKKNIVVENDKNTDLGTIILKESNDVIKCYTTVSCCNSCNNTNLITITPEDIKRIPSVTGEPDLMQALQVMGCPRESASEETNDNAVISEDEQGPFTGFEGHNFIEHPAIIYPNPVKDILQVKSTDPITVIEILGITGQMEMILDTRSTMDVSTLAAGTYYVRIHFENIKDVQVEKIIIIK